MVRVRFMAFAFVVSLAATARAQNPNFRRILDSIRTTNGFPAFAAAVFTTDSIIAYDAVGVRRAGRDEPVTRDDRFHIGSNTKAMTAGLLGLLVDRGKLRWDATLSDVFPDLAATMRPEIRTITVRELLTHRSGFLRDPAGSYPQRTPRAQREAFVRWIVQQPLASERGRFAYANSNYIVAGAIAERIYGGDYESLIVEHLLKPLGMADVRFGPAASLGTVDAPWGHRPSASGGLTAMSGDNPPLFGPAGRANLSVHDFALWGQAALRASVGLSSPWSKETGRALVTPPPNVTDNQYALGWGVNTNEWAGYPGRTFSHSGSNTMNFSIISLAPEGRFGVIVATNVAGPGPEIGKAMGEAAARMVRYALVLK